jgi:hypothetical protein
MIIEAVRPYEWRDRFPGVSQINNDTREKFSAKWDQQLAALQARQTQQGARRG